MKDYIRFPLVLGVICIIAAVGVGGLYVATRVKIEDREQAAREESLVKIFGGEASFTVLNAGASVEDAVYKATDAEGKLIGLAAIGTKQGYSSRIFVMVGADPEIERIIGIDIVSQNETPGLGSRVEETRSDLTWGKVLAGEGGESKESPAPWFQARFANKTFAEVKAAIGGEGGEEPAAPTKAHAAKPAGEPLAAITGATISSNAVFNAVLNARSKMVPYATGKATP